MSSRTVVCKKYLKRLEPLEHLDAYFCPGCQVTVSTEELFADAAEPHVLTFPHKKRSMWPEEREAMRGAVSLSVGEAGALSKPEE